MNSLADLYYKQGKYDEAELLYVECWDMRKTKLGPDHPDTLDSINNLANLYSNQDRYDDAVVLLMIGLNRIVFERVIEALLDLPRENMRSSTGVPDVKLMDALAVILREVGQYEEAKSLYR